MISIEQYYRVVYYQRHKQSPKKYANIKGEFMQKKEKDKQENTTKPTELTQWHPAFCSATKLELVKNKKDLQYHSEYGLNTKPIQVDLLVIRKAKDAIIENEIGKIFKGHNLFEYKSPKDKLNVDTYFKTLAYACLYKAKAPTVNGIDIDDITISIVREQKPIKLFQWFQCRGYEIDKRYSGIYYIKNHFHLDIQIIVLKELNNKLHLWLSSLTQTIEADTAKTLILEINKLTEKDECEFADSVLQVAMKENTTTFIKIKEVSPMCEELAKLMEPEMREARKIAEKEGREQGLKEGREEGRRQGVKEGREEGIKEGIKEGRKEGEAAGVNLSITIIKKLQAGKSVEEIAEETKADMNVIETIRKSLEMD